MAWIAQKPPAHRPNPPRTTSNKAPHTGAAPGAGHQAQLATLIGQLTVEILEQTAALHLHYTSGTVDLTHGAQLPHQHHHTAFEGDALAIVPCSRTPQGERDTSTCTGSSHRHHGID